MQPCPIAAENKLLVRGTLSALHGNSGACLSDRHLDRSPGNVIDVARERGRAALGYNIVAVPASVQPVIADDNIRYWIIGRIDINSGGIGLTGRPSDRIAFNQDIIHGTGPRLRLHEDARSVPRLDPITPRNDARR